MVKKFSSKNKIGYFGVCEHGKDQAEEWDKENVTRSYWEDLTSSGPKSWATQDSRRPLIPCPVLGISTLPTVPTVGGVFKDIVLRDWDVVEITRIVYMSELYNLRQICQLNPSYWKSLDLLLSLLNFWWANAEIYSSCNRPVQAAQVSSFAY